MESVMFCFSTCLRVPRVCLRYNAEKKARPISTEPARSDIALDITWLFPDGSKVSQERSLKIGSLGTIYGRGSSRGPPNWRVGRYVLDFSWHGKKLASAEFNVIPKPFFPVPPPVTDFDGTSLQLNVSGHMRFYEGPSQAPPAGSRQYRNAFEGRYVRWVWCEIYLSNAGDQAPRNFTVTNVIYRDGVRLARWTNTFMSHSSLALTRSPH